MQAPTMSWTATTRSRRPPYLAEKQGRAMGSSLHLLATGDRAVVEPLIGWAEDRVHELERRWSRFIDTSEVSQLNHNPGRPIQVSSDTVLLVQRAIEARQLSQGRFDPTLLQAIKANGYDRTFASIKAPVDMPCFDAWTMGLGGMTVDVDNQTVTLDPGTGFDPGGIGKGLAADLVAEEMVQQGARGALVNVGGDLRCVGQGPAGGSWIVAVGDAAVGVEARVLELAEGGVASSTCQRRRWKRRTARGTVDAHHLLDPETGMSSPHAANLVTVVAGCCSDAEWLATALAAHGALPDDASILGDATVWLTNHLGATTSAGCPERFVR